MAVYRFKLQSLILLTEAEKVRIAPFGSEYCFCQAFCKNVFDTSMLASRQFIFIPLEAIALPCGRMHIRGCREEPGKYLWIDVDY
jgi:hypothetical protein